MSFILQALLHSPLPQAVKYLEEAIMRLNRNGRVPKRANHGARPCSSVMRRLAQKEHYKRWKPSLPSDLQELSGDGEVNMQDSDDDEEEKPAAPVAEEAAEEAEKEKENDKDQKK